MMKDNSPLCTGDSVFSLLFLLFLATSNAKPIEYEDVVDLLPTEPQTMNDTLAAVVQDPVVQDAVQDTVGNGSLEGLVVKKKILIMPATEPTKVVSQREQVLVVPMVHLEDVRKNITESVNTETNVENVAFTNVQFLTDDNKNVHKNENIPSSTWKHSDSYNILTDSSTQKFTSPIDYTSERIPHLLPNVNQKTTFVEHPSSTISVPIIAFLNPAEMSNDKIDMSIAAVLPIQDDIAMRDPLGNRNDKIQSNIERYTVGKPWSTDANNWQFITSPSQMKTSSSLHGPMTTTTVKSQDTIDAIPESLFPVVMPRIDIIKPLFWTSDTNVNYPKDPQDMDVAADIVFRPLFRFRQEAERKSASIRRRNPDDSYRKTIYQRYNPYDYYPRRNYEYSKSRYSDDYYY